MWDSGCVPHADARTNSPDYFSGKARRRKSNKHNLLSAEPDPQLNCLSTNPVILHVKLWVCWFLAVFTAQPLPLAFFCVCSLATPLSGFHFAFFCQHNKLCQGSLEVNTDYNLWLPLWCWVRVDERRCEGRWGPLCIGINWFNLKTHMWDKGHELTGSADTEWKKKEEQEHNQTLYRNPAVWSY